MKSSKVFVVVGVSRIYHKGHEVFENRKRDEEVDR